MHTCKVRLLGITLAVLAMIAVLSACGQSSSGPAASSGPGTAAGGPTSKSSIAYRPQPLKPALAAGSVSLAEADILRVGNGSFALENMSFMAYQLDGKTYLRADICPPCGSRSFTLSKGKLICNACGTVFNAATGAGVSGACTAYPKAAVAFTSDGTNVVATLDALTTAYTRTINRQGLQ